jgi:hypothetical protein
MINVMPPGSATQEGALREFCVWRNCSGSVCEQLFSQTTFMEPIWHGTDLAWNRSGMKSIWVLLFPNFAGRIAKPFRLLKFAPYSSENQFKLPIVL